MDNIYNLRYEHGIIRFNKNNYPFISNGKQTDVYLYDYGNKVIKLFKNNKYIDEEIYIKLRNISRNNKFKYIILPDNLLYDTNNNFVGTISKYIDGEYEIDNYLKDIQKMDKTLFLNMLKNLINEIEKLYNLGIRVDDINISNMIFNNNQLYMIDYGMFTNSNYESIYFTNYFNKKLISDIIKRIIIKEKLDKSIDIDKISIKYIDSLMNEKDTVKELIYKM